MGIRFHRHLIFGIVTRKLGGCWIATILRVTMHLRITFVAFLCANLVLRLGLERKLLRRNGLGLCVEVQWMLRNARYPKGIYEQHDAEPEIARDEGLEDHHEVS